MNFGLEIAAPGCVTAEAINEFKLLIMNDLHEDDIA